MKFHPQGKGSTNYATFGKVKETIEDYIQKSYEKNGIDVAMSLREMKVIDLEEPTRKQSIKTNADEKAFEQESFDIDYKLERDAYLKNKLSLEHGLKKAAALIYQDYCTNEMQLALKAVKDFTTDIKNDPIALLESIEELMYTGGSKQHPLATLTTALNRVMTLQQNDMPLTLYYEQFKQASDLVLAQLGPNFLDFFTEHTPEYTRLSTNATNKKKALKDQAPQRWFAFLFIKNSDGRQFGSIKKYLITNYAFESDNYPKTLEEAKEQLNQHYADNYGKKPKINKSIKDDNESVPRTVEASTSFHQNKPICYCCGEVGHIPYDCTKKDTIPSNEWWIKKQGNNRGNNSDNNSTGSNSTDNSDNNESTNNSTNSNNNRRTTRRNGSPHPNRRTGTNNHQQPEVSWTGAQFYSNLAINKNETNNNLDNVIILDTGTNFSATIKNPKLIEDVVEIKHQPTMATNAGNKSLSHYGHVPGYGAASFDPNHIANAFGFASMIDKGYRITYDSNIEDAFIVTHVDGTNVKFKRDKNNLYSYQPKATMPSNN